MKANPTVLYDGDCGFCGWAVRWVLRRDRRRRFRFAPLGSDLAGELLERHGLPRDPGTVVVLDDGEALVRGDAVLRVLRRLGGPWHLLRVGALLPRPVRNAAYDWIARHRGRIGKLFRTAPIASEERRRDERFLG